MRFLSAKQLFNGKHFLSDTAILVLDDTNCFKEIVDKNTLDESIIEYHDGIICPGFVNAHCHTELSYLHKKIKEKTGFVGFANELIAIRPSFSKDEIFQAIISAEAEMWNNGIVAVGDISNTSDSFEMKAKSKIAFHTFIELIALNPLVAEKVIAGGKELQQLIKNHTSTLSPHAPYSVSPELMKGISENCPENLTISIHNQESKAENDFFEKGNGRVIELYKNLNIDISYFTATGKTALQSYLKYLPINRNLVLVHNTFTNTSDIKFAEALHQNVFWCLCPNANLYIENALPDLKIFTDNNCKMVIGTDSLASNHSLSILDELNTLLINFKDLNVADLLRWATSNGAKALNMEDKVGAFIKAKNAGLNLIRFNNSSFSFIKKLA